ncbi:TIM-barrel domain-containing protein [Psychroserpens sp. AS72]|uniref:TIM-barrel domain-containing protein n=1 Tax=Psychroserpens sp. AS72 TaxID=3135775 RepID=UPI00316D14E4
MKKIAYILGLLIGFSVSAQVTIIVEDLPKETPENASIFISGSFEGWTGGQKEYQLVQKDGIYAITLPEASETLQFKFTQGSWKSVECSKKGLAVDNRNYAFNQPNDTLKVKIAGWTNLYDVENVSTAAKNVSVISEDFEIPQLNRKRRIWLYLPPNYETSNESYPVVYMHDAQNLFDNSTSFSGEWSVDETLNRLYSEKNIKVIVVGIDNGGEKRTDEYNPWENEKYGGGEGKEYTNFIVQTLKPYIDSNYKTLKDKSNTAIFGSSMGGLISYYVALKHPNIFGKVGVFSPSFWFSPKVNDFSKTHGNIKDTKMYFLAGGREGGNVAFEEISQTVKDMNSVITILKNQGFNPKNIQSKIVPEGKHNEELWRTNFEETMLWLFSDHIKERTFVDATWNNDLLQVNVSDGTYQIQFYTSEIVETTFLPTGETALNSSHAVIAEPSISSIQFLEKDEEISLKSEGVNVNINKSPFQISYTYKGKNIISEKAGYVKNDSLETIQFNLDKDEVLYGGGARALGMNRRGNRLELYNKAHYGYETKAPLMNFTLPIVMSSNQYMVHFDNAPIGFLDLDSRDDNTLTYETISGRKTYQVIVGDSWYDIVDNYTDLTGKQPMLPRWALGNFSSRFGYHSQKEVVETIDKFREEEIPVDAIILDLYWFGKDIKGTMGNLEFDRDSFPNPKQMIKDLKSKNVETILITEPFMLTTSHRWDEAVRENILAKDAKGDPFIYDFYFGNTGLIDIFSQDGKLWFKNVYNDLSKLGVNGFWGDLGEPEVHPSELIHATGTADEVHNIYGHDWAKLVQEASLEANPEKRPFILMRAGYSGSQRYGLVPWSGDVNRTWGGLQSQPEIALQMGMQGLAYMHSDLGGFAGANLDDELYARWLQYGVFQPIYRPHAQEEVASEPVYRSDKAKALAKEAIELRYRLTPYNYNLMFENNQTGVPLMRPLFFEDADNLELFEYSEAYLWGNDILVAPILKAGQTTNEVYFPKHSNWFDFYSTNKYQGGSVTAYKLEENTIPTFVRGGAFIPMISTINSLKLYDSNNLVVHYYYDDSISQSKRKIYNDDGATVNAFEKEAYEILEFEAELKGRRLEIEIEAEIGKNYNVNNKNIQLVIHNMPSNPKRIKVDGEKVEGNWNSKKQTVTIPLTWNTSKDKEIKIKLNK